MPFIIIYTTNPDIKTARNIATTLIKKRLIACANFFPIKSIYRWKGKIENADEVVSILKTSKSNWNKVKSEIEKLHPYETPCIIKISASANALYQRWIETETK